MQYISCLWGNDYVINNIELINNYKVTNPDTIFYTYGSDITNKLRSIGLRTVQLGATSIPSISDSTSPKFFYHKVEAIMEAVSKFKEVVYLDIDCLYTNKVSMLEIKNTLRKGSELQSGFYTYPKNFINSILDPHFIHSSREGKMWVLSMYKKVIENGYEFSTGLRDYYLMPNAGFVYCRNEYLWEEIYLKTKVGTYTHLPEEFGLLDYYKSTKGVWDFDCYFSNHSKCLSMDSMNNDEDLKSYLYTNYGDLVIPAFYHN